MLITEVYNVIYWINHYPMEGAIGFPNAYLLDSDLSREYHYLTNQVLQYCPIQFTGMDEMDACGIYD